MTDKNNTKELLGLILEGIDKVKGENVVLLDLQKIETAVTDYFVICSADSSTQVNAIANSVEKTVRNASKERPIHSEGRQTAQWILLDYVNIIVHVFDTEARTYYDLESLWGDAKRTEIENK